MLLSVGTPVVLKYTGETGYITELLGQGMVRVRLDSNHEIPVFEDDLMRDSHREVAATGARFITVGQPHTELPPRTEIKSQYVILKSKGIQLCFEPMPAPDGTVLKFTVWLLNDTPDEVWVELQLVLKEKVRLEIQDKLNPMTALDVGKIFMDDLNFSPEVRFRCQRITTAGVEMPIVKSLKIKSKQFFNRMLTAPILNCPVYHYVLIDNLHAPPAAADEGAVSGLLFDYTQKKLQQVRSRSSAFDDFMAPVELNSVEAFAHFHNEIDLHIEKLTSGYARMNKSMILRLQMEHFEQFMSKAIQLGVPRVYIIHGVGEGKLKAAIAGRLREMPAVKKFKNEYHHKYGYGATEVILED